MQIMECRHTFLEDALQGLQETGVPLLSSHNLEYSSAGYTDDIGIYYFIPWIADHLGISIDSAISTFFGSLLALGTCISICCFCLIFKDWISRAASTIGILLLTYTAYGCSDVYIAPYFAISVILPLFLIPSHHLLWLRLAFSGLVIGYSNVIRSHAGTGALLFLLAWIWLHKDLSKKVKFSSLFVLAFFIFIPYAHFHILEAKRDQFIATTRPSHKPVSLSHPKWHSIYIGLGYMSNPYGIQYSDTCASEKVRSIDPEVVYCSKEYEEILKTEYLTLLRNDPITILKSFACKFFVICYKILKFLNISILFIFYLRPPLRTCFPFLFSAFWYSLPGLLVIPATAYLTGFVSTVTLFGIYMICLGIQKFRKLETSIQPV